MLLSARAAKETAIATEILAGMSVESKPLILKTILLINICIHGTLGRRVEVQVLEDGRTHPRNPHVDYGASECHSTNS